MFDPNVLDDIARGAVLLAMLVVLGAVLVGLLLGWVIFGLILG